MQVTMTMEEYEDLTFKNERVLEEIKEKHSMEILAIQNRFMAEIRKLKAERNNDDCDLTLNLTIDELNWILSWACVSNNEFGFDRDEHKLYEKLHDLKFN